MHARNSEALWFAVEVAGLRYPVKVLQLTPLQAVMRGLENGAARLLATDFTAEILLALPPAGLKATVDLEQLEDTALLVLIHIAGRAPVDCLRRPRWLWLRSMGNHPHIFRCAAQPEIDVFGCASTTQYRRREPATM
jgi:hypothetical protein